MFATPLDTAGTAVQLFFMAALLSVFLNRHQRLLINVSFVLTAIASLLLLSAGWWTVNGGLTDKTTLLLGLPGLNFHMRLDPLAGFFLTVIGLLAFFVSVYSIGYVRGYVGQKSVTSLVVFYCLFLVGMALVVMADDAVFFLICWEMMAAASYFLVVFEDEHSHNRRAALLYIIVAVVGAAFILLSFGVMASSVTAVEGVGVYTFDAMRSAHLSLDVSPGMAAAAFFLAFTGFAAKAGVIPLHVWLPEAHPVAPSNVSALMSGVMLKTAIYGILRVTFDLIGIFPWWWGAIVLSLGLLSAVMGVLYAVMQTDLKKLLAYSSVENIGIILIGIGLAMIFTSYQLPMLAGIALIAALYHTINHAVFKGLLFMGAGAVVHSTGQRNMDAMGGLIHRMPWTAVVFLVGCASVSALPPLNGFVSEWLTFQAFLLSPSLPNTLLKLLIPMGAALLALTSALAGACFVKAFGVTFLGHYRGQSVDSVHEVNLPMRIAMTLSALTCLVLGVLPTFTIGWLNSVTHELTSATIATSSLQGSGTHWLNDTPALFASGWGADWLWLIPLQPQRASYSAPVVFIGVFVVVLITYVLLHVRSNKIKRVPVWDCGFEKLTTTMQYNATSFSMPIRRIFGFLFSIKERFRLTAHAGNKAFPERFHHYLRISDLFWVWLYRPVIEAALYLARRVGMLQLGRIQVYLIYSFVVILTLLVFLR
ncbi:hydrogenase-4 subunit B [Candidatus Magnetobacterium bavaricum]|uniref:Hydrogenase-4 subunit B n=1 Tax=Candidatus Magnetobacterium bavaricum TaxID=29290 RepID=A0A0F3GQT4_9BACT|nr:hydrogenase-4 subunit B [Candidatus Magnetobacterium bavaricum]